MALASTGVCGLSWPLRGGDAPMAKWAHHPEKVDATLPPGIACSEMTICTRW